jgi:hypothetical protein
MATRCAATDLSYSRSKKAGIGLSSQVLPEHARDSLSPCRETHSPVRLRLEHGGTGRHRATRRSVRVDRGSIFPAAPGGAASRPGPVYRAFQVQNPSHVPVSVANEGSGLACSCRQGENRCLPSFAPLSIGAYLVGPAAWQRREPVPRSSLHGPKGRETDILMQNINMQKAYLPQEIELKHQRSRSVFLLDVRKDVVPIR